MKVKPFKSTEISACFSLACFACMIYEYKRWILNDKEVAHVVYYNFKH